MARIAIVGQEWLPRALLRAELEEAGHNVAGYESLAEVIPPLRIGLLPLDLLIFDSVGAYLDPNQLRELRKAAGSMPILILSGHFGDISQVDFRALGFQGVMARPVLIRSIVERTDEYLTGRA